MKRVVIICVTVFVLFAGTIFETVFMALIISGKQADEQMKKYKAMFRPIELYMGSMFRSNADPVKPKKNYPER